MLLPSRDSAKQAAACFPLRGTPHCPLSLSWSRANALRNRRSPGSLTLRLRLVRLYLVQLRNRPQRRIMSPQSYQHLRDPQVGAEGLAYRYRSLQARTIQNRTRIIRPHPFILLARSLPVTGLYWRSRLLYSKTLAV